MNESYNPKSYWTNRLSNNFNFRGVGHIGFNEFYNKWLYRKKKHTIQSFFNNRSLFLKNVLDIGCGNGFFIKWYTEKGSKVYGIDIAQVSIENLSKKFRDSEFSVIDITASDYKPPKKFDIINMWDVIYHQVDNASFHQAFKNIVKSCNPGALLLFTDQFGAFSDVQVASHVKFRCLDTYQNILPHLGFKLIKILPLYYSLNREYGMLAGLSNYLAPLFFFIDVRIKWIPKDNLSLSIWQFK